MAMPPKLPKPLKGRKKLAASISPDRYDEQAQEWFEKRGIHPTLHEFLQVRHCLETGANPLGIN